jgi:DNA-binding transcriptional MerR regulator
VKINEVEQAVGISKRNIRFYEKEGLLAPGRNNTNGYRDYDPSDVVVLKKIKLLRKLAMPIEEILKIQNGILTTEDALRRHLIKLERDSKNLEQIQLLCAQMAQSAEQLETMDPDKYLEQIEKMEKEGTRFMNINKDKKLRYSAIAVASVIIAFMGTVLGLLM